ncbi:MAG TPA: acyltransferase [Fluviicola sp.]|nr:acyltransferase [Fluviicola sp.]
MKSDEPANKNAYEQNNLINQERLNGLDHLRALAIIIVFLFHYFILSGGQPEWLPEFAKFGWTGVDLFFVLSGFLITSQLLSQVKKGKNISLKEFYAKRFFRIIPAFLVVLLLYFLVPLFREKEALPPLWKFLTFTQNFGLDLKNHGTFSHAWSLCVEEHFYLFLPLILIFLQQLKRLKNAYRVIIVLFLTGLAIRFYVYESLSQNGEVDPVLWYRYIYYPTYNRLDGLLVGVLIASIYQFLPSLWSRIARYGNLWIALGLAILSGAYFLCEDPFTFDASVFGFPLVAVGYGSLVIGAISPSGFLHKWKSKVTTWIATVSYAIYLTHKGIIHLTHQLLADYEMDSNIVLVICSLTCLLGAFLLNRIIENPFIKWRSKLILDRQPTKLPETPAK